MTSKKEKVRDRDKPRTRKKKPGSSKRSREVRTKLATSWKNSVTAQMDVNGVHWNDSLFSQMKEGSHDHGDEQQSSKEITPEKDEVSLLGIFLQEYFPED